jgi:hypothetical protein
MKYNITKNGMNYSHSVLKTENLTNDEAIIVLGVLSYWFGDTGNKFEAKPMTGRTALF